jgi:uncharacterized protein YllA (UPF0747 family)
MTTESNVPKESAIVEVSQETKDLVEKEMPQETNEVKQATMELIEAIKKRVQSEVQGVNDLARDTYLDVVQKMRDEVEKMDRSAPDRIQESIKQVQKEVEKDLDALFKPMTDFGNRLREAFKAGWETLTAPRSEE